MVNIYENKIGKLNEIIKEKDNKIDKLNEDLLETYKLNVIKNITKPAYKKKTINVPLKNNVWDKWVGSDITTTQCLCCSIHTINIRNFHCGHVIAESKGGKTILENLRPICGSCNSSMGTENMCDFIDRLGLDKHVSQIVD